MYIIRFDQDGFVGPSKEQRREKKLLLAMESAKNHSLHPDITNVRVLKDGSVLAKFENGERVD